MKSAGFVNIGFGLETGSETLLNSIHKQLTHQQIIQAVELIKKVNINISTYLMVGFPGESMKTVEETIRFIKRLKAIKPYRLMGVAPLWIYPKTEIFEIAKKQGLLDESYWLTVKDVPYYTADYSFYRLFYMALKINYYDRPVMWFISICKNYVKFFLWRKIAALIGYYRSRNLRKLYSVDALEGE